MIETELANWIGYTLEGILNFVMNMRGGLIVLFFFLGFASLVTYIFYLMRKETLALKGIR
jgi:uncharacterized protein YybS (DUF2232 family)